MRSTTNRTSANIVDRAFGAENRARLLAEYFKTVGRPRPEQAWKHVYRLLLWIDRTTGLAHCYESDKSQPGRVWYGRSLAFHSWLGKELKATPTGLGAAVDWLFRRAVENFVAGMSERKALLKISASEQRKPYTGMGFPEPGLDPELAAIVRNGLGRRLATEPTPAGWQMLTEKIQAHFAQENKRRNLVGEGFEDLLAEIIRRANGGTKLTVKTRELIQNVPGFNRPRPNEKDKKVDLVVLGAAPARRILATVKWSVRADREEQFATDFDAYSRLERAGENFDYVLLTNEFDPARLVAACARRTGNQTLFKHVVHMNPKGLLAAYGLAPERSAAKVVSLVTNGRLIGLGEWLRRLQEK